MKRQMTLGGNAARAAALVREGEEAARSGAANGWGSQAAVGAAAGAPGTLFWGHQVAPTGAAGAPEESASEDEGEAEDGADDAEAEAEAEEKDTGAEHELEQLISGRGASRLVTIPQLSATATLDQLLSAGPHKLSSGALGSQELEQLKEQQRKLREVESGVRTLPQVSYAPKGASASASGSAAKLRTSTRLAPAGRGAKDLDAALLQQAFQYSGVPSLAVNQAALSAGAASASASRQRPAAQGSRAAQQLLPTGASSSFHSSASSSLAALQPSRGAGRSSATLAALEAASRAERGFGLEPGQLGGRAPSGARAGLARSGSSGSALLEPMRRPNAKAKGAQGKLTSAQRQPDMTFDSSSAPLEPAAAARGAAAIDVGALVDNFTNQTSLRDLRRQLEQSQRSLGESDSFIKRATASWFSTA
jgi:hypothetical protein